LISALETRRRRIEERIVGGESSIATTIADQWRRRRDETRVLSFRRSGVDGDISGPDAGIPISTLSGGFDHDISDSDSDDDDDDDPDNKFSSQSMNDIRRTPPPTFLTPNTSPSSTSTTQASPDDDSSRNAYTLSCKFCANVLTRRGMRARLVADARIHIWSTDEKPAYVPMKKVDSSVKLVGSSYATTTCQCQLIDIACEKCDTVVGYHIAGSEPCETCSRSNHNAHYHLLRFVRWRID
jgi:hypothetical protein